MQSDATPVPHRRLSSEFNTTVANATPTSQLRAHAPESDTPLAASSATRAGGLHHYGQPFLIPCTPLSELAAWWQHTKPHGAVIGGGDIVTPNRATQQPTHETNATPSPATLVDAARAFGATPATISGTWLRAWVPHPTEGIRSTVAPWTDDGCRDFIIQATCDIAAGFRPPRRVDGRVEAMADGNNDDSGVYPASWSAANLSALYRDVFQIQQVDAAWRDALARAVSACGATGIVPDRAAADSSQKRVNGRNDGDGAVKASSSAADQAAENASARASDAAVPAAPADSSTVRVLDWGVESTLHAAAPESFETPVLHGPAKTPSYLPPLSPPPQASSGALEEAAATDVAEAACAGVDWVKVTAAFDQEWAVVLEETRVRFAHLVAGTAAPTPSAAGSARKRPPASTPARRSRSAATLNLAAPTAGETPAIVDATPLPHLNGAMSPNPNVIIPPPNCPLALLRRAVTGASNVDAGSIEAVALLERRGRDIAEAHAHDAAHMGDHCRGFWERRRTMDQLSVREMQLMWYVLCVPRRLCTKFVSAEAQRLLSDSALALAGEGDDGADVPRHATDATPSSVFANFVSAEDASVRAFMQQPGQAFKAPSRRDNIVFDMKALYFEALATFGVPTTNRGIADQQQARALAATSPPPPPPAAAPVVDAPVSPPQPSPAAPAIIDTTAVVAASVPAAPAARRKRGEPVVVVDSSTPTLPAHDDATRASKTGVTTRATEEATSTVAKAPFTEEPSGPAATAAPSTDALQLAAAAAAAPAVAVRERAARRGSKAPAAAAIAAVAVDGAETKVVELKKEEEEKGENRARMSGGRSTRRGVKVEVATGEAVAGAGAKPENAPITPITPPEVSSTPGDAAAVSRRSRAAATAATARAALEAALQAEAAELARLQRHSLGKTLPAEFATVMDRVFGAHPSAAFDSAAVWAPNRNKDPVAREAWALLAKSPKALTSMRTTEREVTNRAALAATQATAAPAPRGRAALAPAATPRVEEKISSAAPPTTSDDAAAPAQGEATVAPLAAHANAAAARAALAAQMDKFRARAVASVARAPWGASTYGM